MKKIVTIGGGGGHSAIVAALKDLPIELSALVNMVDDGGSSGRLMHQRGVHPAGDTRRILSAASPEAQAALEPRNSAGDPAGNLLLAELEQKFSSFQKAIDSVREQFNIPYHVFHLTENVPVLHGKTESGKEISGQAQMTNHIRAHPDDPYAKLWIRPDDTKLSAGARTALTQADYVIITMGDLYASIAPAFCVTELKELWPRFTAKIIWLPNFTVVPGQVHYKTTSEALGFLQSLNPAFRPDIIIAHDHSLTPKEQQRLVDNGYVLSEFDLNSLDFTIIKDDLIDHDFIPAANPADPINRSPIAYNRQKLQSIFKQILL